MRVPSQLCTTCAYHDICQDAKPKKRKCRYHASEERLSIKFPNMTRTEKENQLYYAHLDAVELAKKTLFVIFGLTIIAIGIWYYYFGQYSDIGTVLKSWIAQISPYTMNILKTVFLYGGLAILVGLGLYKLIQSIIIVIRGR